MTDAPVLPQIAREDLADDAVLLDVRDAAAFAAGHAPGAVNIPVAELRGGMRGWAAAGRPTVQG